MMTFTGNKMDVALFVTVLLQRFGSNCQSITITPRGKLGVYYVQIVTDTLSVDTVERVAQSSCVKLMNTSSENTPGG